VDVRADVSWHDEEHQSQHMVAVFGSCEIAGYGGCDGIDSTVGADELVVHNFKFMDHCHTELWMAALVSNTFGLNFSCFSYEYPEKFTISQVIKLLSQEEVRPMYIHMCMFHVHPHLSDLMFVYLVCFIECKCSSSIYHQGRIFGY
jgi:hypothetical protein